MKTVSVALVGIGGYGRSYLNWFRQGEIKATDAIITAVVDPTAKNTPEEYDWVVSQKIPIYDSLEEMYQQQQVELVIVSSPTQFHKQQSQVALANKSHVLCEKPLVPLAQEAIELIQSEKKSGGYQLGVGFQWSFSPVMNRLKRDIISGKYGKPVLAKTFISWPRAHNYYEGSNWKGRILGDDGQPILDSILANATAHYLHNIFFTHGETQETSRYPEDFSVELYRANPIESFDTCFLRGNFAGGGEFYYVASHAVAEEHSPTFHYQFEHGTVSFNHWEEDDIIYGELDSGERIVYGSPFEKSEQAEKVNAMVRRVTDGVPVVCTTETILPHLLVSNAVFDFGRIVDFPSDIVEEMKAGGNSLGNHIPSLYSTMRECFATAKLPSELPSEFGVAWSQPAITISMDGYKGFTGRQMAK